MCGRYRLSRRFSVVRGIQFRAGGKGEQVRVGPEHGQRQQPARRRYSKNDVNLTVPRQLCRVARSGHAVPALFIVCGRQAATKFGHLMGGL